MAIPEILLGALISLAVLLIGIFASVAGYLFKKIWDLRQEFDKVESSYSGDDYTEGHLEETTRNFQKIDARLDDFEDTISYFERQRVESHEVLCEKIDAIVSVLEKEGFNGDLPKTSDD